MQTGNEAVPGNVAEKKLPAVRSRNKESEKRPMKRTLTLMFGIGCLLQANDDTAQKIQVAKTEHADLPSGGTITLKNSTGELTVEGWDQPGVEMTTIRSTKLAYTAAGPGREKAVHDLNAVKVSMTHEGDGLVVSTDFPRGRRYLPRPSVGARDFDLEYKIKIPRGAKIVVDHDAGEIHFVDLTGDIHATTNQGEITLQLSAGQYSIDAKSRIGDVISDFPGTAARRHLGHEFMQTTQSPHNLYLRTGYGDIVILRAGKPTLP
jgi:hypothetical protein